MTIVPLRGPVVTYVTDEDLDITGQQRVLEDFLACASSHSLRVAFRLPRWTDAKFLELVTWFHQRLNTAGLTNLMPPPLVHDRPEVADAFPGCGLWLPWRNRDLVRESDLNRLTLSVHGADQAREAIAIGAQELVFGHVFTSESHPGEPGRGMPALQDVIDVVNSSDHPPRLTAIGGIDHFTVPEIGRIHFQHVAAVRSISRSTDISLTLQLIQDAWQTASIAAELGEEQRSPFLRPTNLFF